MNRRHWYVRNQSVVNGFMQHARFDAASDAAAAAAGGGGTGGDDTAAKAKAAADAAAAAAGSGGAPNWIAGLSPEVQKLVEIKGWKTPADAITGYTELERLVGQDKIPAPRKDKNGNFEKGELERFLQAAGAPKEVAGYVLPKEIKIEQGAGMTVAQLEAFKPMALKYGLLPHQFNGIMTDFAGMLNKGLEAKTAADTKAYEDAVASLKGELAENYDAKVKLSNRVLQSFIDQKRADVIVKKFGNDPDLIKLLANIGENISEDKLSGDGMGGGVLTPDQAEAEIKTIRADMKHPYFNATHADHAYWVNRVDQLTKMAEAGKKK
jgi:hypothetical protein